MALQHSKIIHRYSTVVSVLLCTLGFFSFFDPGHQCANLSMLGISICKGKSHLRIASSFFWVSGPQGPALHASCEYFEGPCSRVANLVDFLLLAREGFITMSPASLASLGWVIRFRVQHVGLSLGMVSRSPMNRFDALGGSTCTCEKPCPRLYKALYTFQLKVCRSYKNM